MEQPTGYHEKLIEISSEVVNHGFGKVEFYVTSLKDGTIKVTICAGKEWIYFVEKNDLLKGLEGII